MDDATLDALRTAAGAVVDIGVALVVGALATRGLLRGAASGWAARATCATRRVMIAAVGAALAGGVAWMAVEAVSMTDLPPWAAAGESWPIVSGTRAGRLWALQMGLLAICGAAGLRQRERAATGTTTAVASIAVLLLAAARASAGHAGAAGVDAQTVVMAAHLLATGAWAGAVIVAATAVVRRHDASLAGPADRAAVARYLAGLSRLATAALVLVALTGAASGWHALGGRLDALTPGAATSSWAAMLDAKLVLVAVAVALGAFNRFATLRPWLAALASMHADAERPSRRFAAVLRVEAVVLSAVLVAAAVLANAEPPTP